MCGRVLQGMAQFVLKTEKLSHIIGRALMLEMAHANGFRPRFMAPDSIIKAPNVRNLFAFPLNTLY